MQSCLDSTDARDTFAYKAIRRDTHISVSKVPQRGNSRDLSLPSAINDQFKDVGANAAVAQGLRLEANEQLWEELTVTVSIACVLEVWGEVGFH